MAYIPKNEIMVQSKYIKKFDGFDGSWDQYLRYLEQNNALSINIVPDGNEYKLRDGYYPQWKLKDFV